jgi:NAD-dependent dihydropyrimidine dehydrogenase PreA subunit
MVESGLVNDDTDAFYSSGVSVDDLKLLASEAVWKIRAGFAIGGGFLAFVAALEVLRTSRRAQNTTYVADMGSCLCCGRCYDACPDEIIRRKESSK